jgi:hypothetical protein
MRARGTRLASGTTTNASRSIAADSRLRRAYSTVAAVEDSSPLRIPVISTPWREPATRRAT